MYCWKALVALHSQRHKDVISALDTEALNLIVSPSTFGVSRVSRLYAGILNLPPDASFQCTVSDATVMLGARSAVVRTLLSVSIARMSSVANIEAGKKAAAEKAVQEHIKSGQVVGIGSGSTIVYAVDKLADLVKNGVLSGIRCVPTSFQVHVLVL